MSDEPTHQELWRDPIVAEVRQARESLFAAAGYDIYEFCRRLSARQVASGHPVVRRKSADSAGADATSATIEK